MAQRGLEAGVPGVSRSVQGLPVGEREGVPQNSFLQFVENKRELFAGFSSNVRRLREEEKTRRGSPRLVTLLDEAVEILRFGSPSTFDPKKEQEFRRRYKEALFNNTESPLTEDERIQFRRQLSLSYREEWEEWGKRLDQFWTDYQVVRKPLREAVLETRQALFARFEEYLRAELKHLVDFEDFLADPKFASAREGIRHFLTSLAEHVFKTREKDGNILAQLRREWTDEAKEHPRDEILKSYLSLPMKGKRPVIKSIEREGNKVVITGSGGLFEFFSFTRLILRQIRQYKNITLDTPEEEITGEDLCYALKQIPLSEWPESLRNDYQRFAAAKVALVIDGIRKGLGPYRG